MMNKEIFERLEQLEIEYTWSQLAVTYYATVHTPKTTVTNKPYAEDEVSIVVTGGMKNANAIYGSTIESIAYINDNPYYATASSLTGSQSENYKLTVVDEEFIVVQKLLTVTALNDVITYGDEVTTRALNSKYGVAYEGFATGEDENVLNGVISYTYSYDRTNPLKRLASVIAGNYEINALCTTSNTNYFIEYEKGELEVLQKEIGIDWTKTDVSYNGLKQKPEAIATGLVSDYDDTCNITVSEGKKDANAYRLSGFETPVKEYEDRIENLYNALKSSKSLSSFETLSSRLCVYSIVYEYFLLFFKIFKTISFLHNNFFEYKGIAICGNKGYFYK